MIEQVQVQGKFVEHIPLENEGEQSLAELIDIYWPQRKRKVLDFVIETDTGEQQFDLTYVKYRGVVLRADANFVAYFTKKTALFDYLIENIEVLQDDMPW